MAKNYVHKGDIVTMICGNSVASGEMVKISSNAIVPATDGSDIWGIALTNGVTDQWISVLRKGVVRLMAYTGVNFAPGAVAYIKDSVTLDAGTTGDHSCGVVVDKDPASGGEVFLQITPTDLCAVTTHA